RVHQERAAVLRCGCRRDHPAGRDRCHRRRPHRRRVRLLPPRRDVPIDHARACRARGREPRRKEADPVRQPTAPLPAVTTDFTDLDATGQAALIAKGECTPDELLEWTIAAIERVDPQVNAVVVPLFDQARRQVAGDGPFRGVPTVLKDLGATLAGAPQYKGTRALRDRNWVSPADSELTARLRRAGFVFVGKANTPELGLSPTTEPSTFGPTRNPWGLDHIVGGSSGGSAAAVAARMVALAHASDGGGSIRNPAGARGVVGLKPTRGRGTLAPDFGERWDGCATELVITRSVRDVAGVLDAVAGYAPGDPAPAPPPARPFSDEVGRDPGRLRVGTYVGTPASDVPQVAVERCAALLAELGHDVGGTHPSALDEEGFGAPLAASIAVAVARYVELIADMTGAPVPPEGLEP